MRTLPKTRARSAQEAGKRALNLWGSKANQARNKGRVNSPQSPGNSARVNLVPRYGTMQLFCILLLARTRAQAPIESQLASTDGSMADHTRPAATLETVRVGESRRRLRRRVKATTTTPVALTPATLPSVAVASNTTWDLDTDRGVSQLLASNGDQLVVVPTNKGGLSAALWLRREISRLGVLDVPLLVSDTANLCAHVKVPCAYTVQCTEPHGSFGRVLCAKLFALARLFVAGADVFVIDSDAVVLSAKAFHLWRGPMRNTSMVCQVDNPFINTGEP